jgi:hypothetical protein
MRTLFIGLLLQVCFSTVSFAQTGTSPMIKIKLQNSSLLPKRVTIITYQPGDSGNATEQVTVLPKSKKERTYREGTKLYLADSRQVDVVMSGKRIDQNKPFLVVKKEDAGKTFVF